MNKIEKTDWTGDDAFAAYNIFWGGKPPVEHPPVKMYVDGIYMYFIDVDGEIDSCEICNFDEDWLADFNAKIHNAKISNDEDENEEVPDCGYCTRYSERFTEDNDDNEVERNFEIVVDDLGLDGQELFELAVDYCDKHFPDLTDEYEFSYLHRNDSNDYRGNGGEMHRLFRVRFTDEEE